ncbi:MAG: hypothetical protein Q9192_003087 [Flavoplaca navasiana]
MANTRTICIAAAPYLGDTLVPEIIGSITVLTILAVGAVILRFLARSLTNVSYGLDDWLILFALVSIDEDETNHVQMILKPIGLGVIDSAIVGSIVRIPILHGLNRNDPTYTTTHPGIWLNVELSIGILSASLPLMRPLVSRAKIRSRFSKSRKTGSYRLQDVEGPNAGISSNSRAPHSKGLSDSGVYQGQNKRQPYKSWYNAGTYISSNGDGRHSKEGSEEGIVPMGKIHVKHDLEQEQGHGSISQKSGASDTLG